MKLSITIILVLICVVLGAAVYFGRGLLTPAEPGLAVGDKLFPAFPVNDIVKVVLRDGDTHVTLERRSEGWVVDEYYDYPARFSAVADLIRQIYDMKVGQKVRVKPASLVRLQLADPASGAPGAARVATFYLADGTPAAELLIGSEKAGKPDPRAYGFSRPQGQFVRLPGGEHDAVYLVDNVYDFDVAPDFWIEKQLFNVLNTDLSEITVTSPGGDSYTLVRPAPSSQLELVGIAPTQQLVMSEANSVASGVSYFRVDSVLPPAAAETNTALERAWTYVGKTFDGRVFTFDVSDTNIPTAYVRIQVAYEQPAEAAATTNTTAETAAKSPYALRDETVRLNERIAPWTYVLDNYKAGELRKPLDELVQPTPEAVERAAEPAASDTSDTPDSSDTSDQSDQSDQPDAT
jgi:hypothetical protein